MAAGTLQRRLSVADPGPDTIEIALVQIFQSEIRTGGSRNYDDRDRLLNRGLINVITLVPSPYTECLALRWSDVDWLNGRLRVERGIVERNVDDVKTDESRKSLAIAEELLDQLKVWKQSTEFSADSDWIFASPVKIGRLPYSYTGVWRELDRAANAAGIGHIGTHTFRHSYRMWIDALGTPIGVQQKLMRHSDIRTTMNIYGDAATEDMRKAHSKIVRLALQTV
jgi:integrase